MPDRKDAAAEPALVILAAGASRRLGECKALADIGGRAVLEHLLDASACLDAGPPLVVTGRHHDAIAARAPDGVELLHNPDWERGRTGGVLLALAARPGRDLVIAPVDCPLVPASVFVTLLAEWRAAGRPPRGWLGPRYRSRHGHPIVFGRALGSRLGLKPESSLRLLRDAADPLWNIAVDAPEVLDDLDTPGDLARLRKTLADRTSDGA